MRYIKTYEDLNREPEVGDWIVAHRPPKNYDVYSGSKNYIIDIGKVNNIIKEEIKSGFASDFGKKVYKTYYDVQFRGGRYMRLLEHFLYIAKNKEDAEEYIRMLDTTNKYNI